MSVRDKNLVLFSSNLDIIAVSISTVTFDSELDMTTLELLKPKVHYFYMGVIYYISLQKKVMVVLTLLWVISVPLSVHMTNPMFENYIHFPLSLPFVTQVYKLQGTDTISKS